VEVEGSLSEAGDALQNAVGRLDPNEGFGFGVAVLDVRLNGVTRLVTRAVAAAT
jgi:hypothetical protein